MTSPLPPRLLQIVIAADSPARLDKALARDVPEGEALSRSRLARLIADGAVRRGDAVLLDTKARVNEGDILTIALAAPVEIEARPEAIPLDIVFEDDDLIVLNKSAGMVVHPAPGSPDGTLVNALLHHCGDSLSGVGGAKRPGIVHRIDKDTSGLLVVAKSDAAHHGLAAQFEAHTAKRQYLALCHGCPDPSSSRLRGLAGVTWEPGHILRIGTDLARHPHDRQRQAVVKSGHPGARRAVTRVDVAQAWGQPHGVALVGCRLETGRTHQIRVHMTYAGHALIGDPIYGQRRRVSARVLGTEVSAALDAFPRQALHAANLGFTHPTTGQDLFFECPLPHDMAELIVRLNAEVT